MPKSLDPALQSHLDSRATTLCFCWKVTRRDNVVQGFTDHDNDLTFGGVTYLASSGFTATQVQNSLGLAVDNLEVEGALSSDTINEADLQAGRYDQASVELFWVNWKNVSQRVLVNRGTIGEVKRSGVAFSAELRGLSNALQQKIGRKYQKTCDAIVGDNRCKVNLNLAAYRGLGTVTASGSRQSFTASGLGGFANDWFSAGVVTWTSGPNNGHKMEVKVHRLSGGVVSIQLWQPMPFDIAVGHTFAITAGCKQDHETCAGKFGNIANFRGFNLIPPPDVLLWYVVEGEEDFNGGSLINR